MVGLFRLPVKRAELALRLYRLKYFGAGKAGGTPDSSYVLPGAFVAQMLTMPLGPYFQKWIGCRVSCTICCVVLYCVAGGRAGEG